MSDKVIIYIAPPSSARGQWRVRSDGRPEEERPDEKSAVDFAVTHAQMIINAGGVAVVRIERTDGSWETLCL
jgi:P pilus assembly chaperone PapD